MFKGIVRMIIEIGFNISFRLEEIVITIIINMCQLERI